MPRGTFVLADIGGYTSFLTDVGIEHAKEITAHLLNGLFEVDPDAWKLGDVEGDCLFVYSDTDHAPEEVFSYLRRLYECFRESLEEVVSGSTCRCGACDRSGDLTLKFVVHAGDFDVEKIAGQRQLIGADVVVAHRLLKNGVPCREYALLTAPLADVAQASGLTVHAGSDDCEGIGTVDYAYLDLETVRETYYERREVFLSEADADVTATVEIDAPPDFVWKRVCDLDRAPEFFPTLIQAETLSGKVEEAGSVHTCLHGNLGRMIHYRVAYDEERRRATDRLSHVPIIDRMIQTMEAEASGGGTRFSFYYALAPEVVLPDEATRAAALQTVQEHANGDAQGVKALCEAEYRAR